MSKNGVNYYAEVHLKYEDKVKRLMEKSWEELLLENPHVLFYGPLAEHVCCWYERVNIAFWHEKIAWNTTLRDFVLLYKEESLRVEFLAHYIIEFEEKTTSKPIPAKNIEQKKKDANAEFQLGADINSMTPSPA